MRILVRALALSACFAPTLATAQDLGSNSQANAVVQTSLRYATPAGSVAGGIPTNAPPTGPGAAVLPGSPFDNASGWATASYGNFAVGPFATATASLSAGPFNPAGQGVSADAYVFYAFEIVGPANLTGASATVDVTASAFAKVDASAEDGSASASVVIQDGALDLLNRSASIECSFGSCTSTTNFSLDRAPLSVPINQVILVFLNADANSQVPLGSADSTGAFTASIDPVIALDLQNPAGLSLVLGSPVVQPSAVPEPQGWLLAVVGILFVGLGSRQRHSGQGWMSRH